MFYLGMIGMPRRYYDYLPQFETGHVISTIGSWIMIIGLVIILTNILKAKKLKGKIVDNPWDGATLEWSIPSPPPLENFEEIPVVTGGPYEFK